jgi:hypothetical protein
MEETYNIHTYNKSFDIDDIFIIVFDDMIEILGVVKEIDSSIKTMILKTDNGDYKFAIDDNNLLLTKTDDYNIIDLELVQNFEFDNLDDNIELSLTKDIYPNIEISITEKEKYDYNDTEKRESLITSLVVSMKVYDDPIKIKNIATISDNFLNMIYENKNIALNHFEEILYFDINQKLPNWLIPVCKDHKRMYFDKADIINPIIQEDYIQVVFEDEYKKLNELFETTNGYTDTLNIYNDKKYKSIQNINNLEGFKLKKYPHDFFRECLADTTCTGPNNNYNIDTRHNYKDFSIKFNDIFNTYIDYQECNVIGLLYLSDRYNFKLPFEYDNRIISLVEKCLFIENKYSIYSNNIILNEYLTSNTETVYCNFDDTFKYDSDKNYKNDTSIIYKTNDSLALDDFQNLLNIYIPNQDTILQNYYYKNIYNNIYNYIDFEKVFIRYNINITNISQNNKNYINDIVNKNVRKYIKFYDDNYKNISYNKKDIIIQKIPLITKINNLKNFISKQTDIVYQNYLYDKFIKYFILPDTVNHNLISKYDNTPLLCEHYLLQSKIDKDSNIFDTLKQNYGMPKQDGIYCKYCGEFLFHVEMSNIQGFENNIPIVNKPLSKIENTHIYENEKLKDIILLLSNNLGIKIHDDDLFEIYNNSINIDHNTLSDTRYNLDEFLTKNHPLIEKAKLIKDKKKSIPIIKNINIYTKSTNLLLFIICNLYIYIQISIPSYKNIISILDFKDNNYSINKTTINKILSFLRRFSLKYKNDAEYKYIETFLNDNEIEHTETQIENILTYILSPQFANIINRINIYKIYIGYTENIYLKKYYNTYRPLNTDKNIIKINNIVNDSIKTYKDIIIKNRNTKYALENISFLQDIKKYENTKIFELLKIENLELLNNSAFLTLYDYILTLYGFQIVNNKQNNYIEILIAKFYETIDYKEIFDIILNRNVWKKNNQISFRVLRNLIVDIFKYCKNKGECIKTLNIFNHISFNNDKLLLTNVYPKRSYDYIFIDNIPDLPQDNLKDLPIIDKFYKSYCYDINKKIIKRNSSEVLYKSLYLELDFRFDMCDENLSLETTFSDIINTIYKQNMFKNIFAPSIKSRKYDIYTKNDIDLFNKKNNIEDRLIRLLNIDEFKRLPNLYDLYDITVKMKEDDTNADENIKNLDKIYDRLIHDTDCMVNKIIEYIDDDKLDKFKNIMVDNSLTLEFYKNNIQYMIFIISKLKNNYLSSNYLPNTLKLNDYNNDILNKFLKIFQYLTLSNKFPIKNTKQKQNKGYYKYFNDPNSHPVFDKLYNMYIEFNKYLYLIVGKSGNIFDNNKARYLYRYFYILSFYKILEFINFEDDCDIEMDGNEIYNSLNTEYDNTNTYNQKILKSFLIDIITDNIEIYYDKNWIYALTRDEALLQSKLSEQGENEKQEILKKKNNMTAEERGIYIQTQQIGLSNEYKFATKINEQDADYELKKQYLEAQLENDELEDESDLQINPNDQDDSVHDDYDSGDEGSDYDIDPHIED